MTIPMNCRTPWWCSAGLEAIRRRALGGRRSHLLILPGSGIRDRIADGNGGRAQPVDVSTDSPALGAPIVRSAAEAATLGVAFQYETRGDEPGRFLYIGGRCRAVTGLDPQAVLADPQALFRLVVPDHRETFARAAAEARAKLQPFDVELALRRPDGALRWHRIATIPTVQPDGAVRWDGMQIDVTHRREMEAELEDQRRRVAVAVAATDLGLWELDIRARRLAWSQTNRALFGVPVDMEISEGRFLALLHPDDRAGVLAAYSEVIEGRETGDLRLEYRIVRPDGEARWLHSRGRLIRDALGPARLVGTTLDITERRAAEDGRNLLMGELAHRAKNGIAVIMAIISQSARGQESVEAFEASVMARLHAMAASQDLVMASGGRPVELDGVIRQALTPFGLAHFDIDAAFAGVTVRGELAVGLGLMLHELATNATKYGALSVAKGRVSLSRRAAAEGRAALAWRERGGPPVAVSARKGFGTRLLEQALRHQDGEVQFRFEPNGFQAEVGFPVGR